MVINHTCCSYTNNSGLNCEFGRFTNRLPCYIISMTPLLSWIFHPLVTETPTSLAQDYSLFSTPNSLFLSVYFIFQLVLEFLLVAVKSLDTARVEVLEHQSHIPSRGEQNIKCSRLSGACPCSCSSPFLQLSSSKQLTIRIHLPCASEAKSHRSPGPDPLSAPAGTHHPAGETPQGSRKHSLPFLVGGKPWEGQSREASLRSKDSRS